MTATVLHKDAGGVDRYRRYHRQRITLPNDQWIQPGVERGSFAGFTVSFSRIFPSRPWMETSPPPAFPLICFAAASASAWVRWRLDARSESCRLLTQGPPGPFRYTFLS